MSNTKEAYSASSLPPLDRSDHNLVHLMPTYTPLVKRQAATTRQVRRWSPSAEDTLRDCFATTEWSVLVSSHGENIEEAVEVMTDYMNFCLDQVVPLKTVKCFANNKPWISWEVKEVLNKKKRAYKDKDTERKKEVQREVKNCLNKAKEAHGKKLEGKLKDNNMREVWSGMKTITGCSGKSSVVSEGPHKAEELNLFFNRFNSSSAISTPPLPPSGPPGCAPDSASPSSSGASPPVITADQVRSELRQLHPRKAAGPDGVFPRLLKACADELCEPLQHVFNLSLQLERVPSLWKTSCIMPVPKKTRPCELNDYRPTLSSSPAYSKLPAYSKPPPLQTKLLPCRLAPPLQTKLLPCQTLSSSPAD
ncbi:hypothetical protein WMY93_009176 [Mugilogobius chulae]|uniref:Uncharacterized protein n=1 Tax=Mugilogobius chulae TaxID=88201 RepID=A0AAW0PPL2_9GOBI